MQRRTLTRARHLAAFREAIVARALAGRPLDARRRAVVVPTRAAAELLRQSIERGLSHGRRAVVLPDFVTRQELIERLAASLSMPDAPRLLQPMERLVLLERAARRTAARPRIGPPPFPLRPGLVSAMLDFYDELNRRQRPVRRFAEALFDQLRTELNDRGSASLIHQTCFLGFTFLAYERAVRSANALDEHGLRRLLLERQPAVPFDELVVAVADHPSDTRGLWPSDFDLLGRLRSLASIDVIVTDALHDEGFRERMETELPGIEETRFESAGATPVLLRPEGAGSREPGGRDETCVVSRDREDELRDVTRAIRRRAETAGGRLDAATAVVFHRPLPYLYLAQRVFTGARVPYQAFDALPLAAQPYAALLDVILTAARTGASRESAVELLRSGLLRIDVDGAPVTGREISALDETLSSRRSIGEADTFVREIEAELRRGDIRLKPRLDEAMRAARAAATARDELGGFRAGDSATGQVRTLLAFLRRHERLPNADDAWADRHLRARAAVQGVLEALEEAFTRHDNAARAPEDIAALIRQAVESRTFTPDRARGGVHLVDAVAARFGTFDHMHLVGLVETDWPERPRRNVFYTAGLLKALGWPQAPDQTRVQQAMFTDLLSLPSRTLTMHAFEFEGDARLARSPLVELARGRAHATLPPPERRRTFDEEVLTEPLDGALPGEPQAAAWLALRHLRPDLALPHYSGMVDAQKARRYRVSRVDRYVLCPFKYFAESVLELPEEREEMTGLTPLERGNLIHELFEAFYRSWDARRAGTITAANLPDAVAEFARLTDDALAPLPEADRALERTRLLGSLVAPGIAERVFELEADKGGDVVARLLEFGLKGPFTFPQLMGLRQRTVEISGKADRIDIFADGSLRVIDYKLSRLPDVRSSIQIAVYAHAVQQFLQTRDRREYRIGSASYLAFGDEDRLEGAMASKAPETAIAVLARAGEFAAVIDRIEAGQFPPRPRQPGECQWCRFAGVCRKEFREGEDEAAESV